MTDDTTKRAEAYLALAEKATPGPWDWRMSSEGRVDLAAPHGGGTIVMDFMPAGPRKAVPRFAITMDDQPRGHRGGILRTVPDLVEKSPDGCLHHPDAEFLTQGHAAAAIIRALLAERQGWRPIETAPGDETRILCLSENSYDVAYVSWHDNAGAPVYFNGDIVINPTHWQPLPSPPTGAKS